VLAPTVAAVPATAQTPPPVITPDEAEQVVRDWYATSYRATEALDGDLLATVEAPPLLTIDQGDFQYRRDEDTPFENLVAEPGSIDVYVPRQTAYPAQFVAKIGVGPTTQWFEFVRESAEAPWRTPYQAAADGFPELPSPIALDKDGYATLVPIDTTKLKVAPGAVPERLVRYLSRYQEPTLPKAKPFGDGPATSDNLKSIRARTREVDATYEFSVVTAPHAAYRTKDGGALVFFAYSSREQAEAPGGGTLRVQPSGLPGPQVPPGRYLSTDTTRTTLVAAAVPPAKPRSGRIAIIGRYTGSVAATGVPEGPTEA
jgi:hypothetical protein